MRNFGGVVILAVVFTACATSPPTRPPGTAYRGEVWTWDERADTVTLRQGPEAFRVKITPDQFATLRLHDTATVYGERIGPTEIATMIVPGVPVNVVPRGAADQSEITGTVASVDPNGVVTVNSSRGALKVWAAVPTENRFTVGAPVRVRVSVQPVDMVPRGRVFAESPQPAVPDPAASVPSEPGDFATLTGRVIAVAQNGVLTLESPRGPVTVWVPDPARYQPGRTVQVRTLIHSGQS